MTLCEEKSITKAAGKLFLTRQGLSKALQKLESEFGVSLFNRSKDGLTLSEYGLMVKDYIDKSDELHRSLIQQINIKAHSKDVVRIGIDPLILHTEHIQEIHRFEKNHPYTKVVYINPLDADYSSMFASNDVDIVISPFVIKSSAIKSVLLTDDDPVILVSNQSPLSKRNSVEYTELSGEKVILPDSLSGRYFAENAGHIFKFEHVTNNRDIIHALIMDNAGIFIANRILALTIVTEGQSIVNISGCPFKMRFYLCYKKEHTEIEEQLIQFISNSSLSYK